MNAYSNVTRYDIEEKLSGGNLNTNRIMSSALCIGALLFLLVIVVLYLQKSADQVIPDQNSPVDMMIMMLLLFTAAVYTFAFIFPKIFLKKENLEKQLAKAGMKKEDPAETVIGIDRTLMIIRLAQLEGITLFGLTTLILSVLNGIIYFNSNYWLLVIPLIIQTVIVVTYYLPKDKIVTRIESVILPAFQNLEQD